MSQDFRVKADMSRIYQDARQNSWIYIDSSKIRYIRQLADHVQKLFDIKKPFHLLSKCDETHFFLPFEEDVRVLENYDTVIIAPGTGIISNLEIEKNESCKPHQSSNQNGFLIPSLLFKDKDSNASFEKSFVSEKSSMQNNSLQNSIENTSGISFTGSLYRTALHDTMMVDDTKEVKMTEDLTEDNSITEDCTRSNKRKRVRKRKQKKPTEIPESDTSHTDISGKKPKIVDSVLLSTSKHIRFEVPNDEVITSDLNKLDQLMQNGDTKCKQYVNKDLINLLSLRQSSTPLTFQHKRIKKDYKPETINESLVTLDTTATINKSNVCNGISSKSMIEAERKENSMLNKSAADDDTISFKVYRIGEDYTPQISTVIIAKVLSKNLDGSQYTLKILHGKEQLQDPEGKFSLPKDDEDKSDEESNVVILEKSKLLELTKV